MQNFIDKLHQYKKVVLIISSILIFLQTVLILTNDITWFWLTIITLPLLTLDLYLFESEVAENEHLKSLSQYISLIVTLMVLLFVLINALFVTPLWWYGMSMPLYLLGQHIYFYNLFDMPIIDLRHKTILVYSTITVFVLMILFYFIPSFIANDSSNPDIILTNSYNAVASYQIYFDEGDRDREHVIARSWYSENHFVNDYINVIWSNRAANNARGNLKFNNVHKNNTTAIKSGDDIIGYKHNDHFMPLDQYKGDVARIVLYMYVTYKDDGLPLEYINIALMKSWARLDPVDQKEVERNNLIKQTYKYSNKFVDMPWLIGFIV